MNVSFIVFLVCKLTVISVVFSSVHLKLEGDICKVAKVRGTHTVRLSNHGPLIIFKLWPAFTSICQPYPIGTGNIVKK